MDQVHVVRHQVLVEGRSQRQVAKELGIARETVRKYLTESFPLRKETQPRARPVWDAVRTRLAALLTESRGWTGGKQQLTATRLHELLVAEGHRVAMYPPKCSLHASRHGLWRSRRVFDGTES